MSVMRLLKSDFYFHEQFQQHTRLRKLGFRLINTVESGGVTVAFYRSFDNDRFVVAYGPDGPGDVVIYKEIAQI